MVAKLFGKHRHLFSFRKINIENRRERIKADLKKAGIRPVDIARLTSRSRSLVSNVIAGRRRSQDIELLINEITGKHYFKPKKTFKTNK